ncbi:MAG TPA: sigma-70 family RNA polymerase sigma factor [bacterium]|uniref:RNA polymerase sigma factor RpoS n=1 Tax=candidate division TA06 bacterium ADurb.Bin417 TaxID=1852828 RepID=A0A1V5MJX0_UNCT6|nr:MAG: RNA polymerase sigma factor RpoS [candidate division TA06 bacterium ADurb.Bin417]HNQ34502.1 sigma-70 family RNA polymerase sigma factor [bacterium]HNS48052.1 sigma-70 family RNA polymerase sigma factor [bacterium]
MTPKREKRKRPPDELEIFYRFARGEVEVRDQIVMEHQALVAKIARYYARKSSATLTELMAEGYIGLLHAIEKFNPATADRKGVKFSSYAYWWIRRYVIRYLMRGQSILCVPESVSELTNRYSHFSNRLAQVLGREPTVLEMKAEMELTEKEFQRVRQRRDLTEISLDEKIAGDEDNRTFAEVITAGPGENLEKTLENEMILERFFSLLNPVEREVLKLRYGLNNEPQCTYTEIASRLQEKFDRRLSRQRIHQIVRAAIEKLKSAHQKELNDG